MHGSNDAEQKPSHTPACGKRREGGREGWVGVNEECITSKDKEIQVLEKTRGRTSEAIRYPPSNFEMTSIVGKIQWWYSLSGQRERERGRTDRNREHTVVRLDEASKREWGARGRAQARN